MNDVATIHTHAAYTGDSFNNEFSGIRKLNERKEYVFLSKDERRNQTGKDIGNANLRKIDSYLVTPNGSLQKYNPNKNDISIISNNMPSDPNDPSRMNNISIEEKNAYSMEEYMKMINNVYFSY